MKRQALYFLAPGRVEVQEEALPPAQPGQVLVQTLCSAISSGTEMLLYRGQAPADLAADTAIAALGGSLAFPLKYGYASVGRVVEVGEEQRAWRDRLVFAFHPHEDYYWASEGELQALPAGLDPEEALFLPNLETALNFLHDGAPLVGEQVVLFGQGIVGLLTTTLLAPMPLARLLTLDRHPLRRQTSLDLGAHASFDPADPAAAGDLQAALHPHGADLLYELSGQPAALDRAIALAGFGARIVIGSWYGRKRADLDLGGQFHRQRLHLLSSQVSTVAPALSGRWDKARRLDFVWQLLARIATNRFISHRFVFTQAAAAYHLLDQQPETAIQVILTY